MKIVLSNILYGILCCFYFFGCQNIETSNKQEDASAVNDADSSKEVLNLEEFLKDKKKEKVVIEYDHVLKTKKEYLGYPLKVVLAPYLKNIPTDDYAKTLVTFVCTDGFKPHQYLSDLLANEGFLVYKDLSQPENKNWPDSLSEKYAPFYLVWKDLPVENKVLNWPYGLETIEIHKTDTMFNAIMPLDASFSTGFQVFKASCILCHSINKIGGDLGPEFNHPKNILDYWEKEDIWNFVQNPQSYRYNSKMARIEDLSKDEFDQMISYLEQMKLQKIK